MMARCARFDATTLALISGVLLGACTGNAAPPGTLVGKYAIRGVLTENTCGLSGLPTVNPLEFNVELREDEGLGYWVQAKSASNSGRLATDGTFRFSVSQTQLLSSTTSAKQLEPSDFRAPDTEFDLQKTTCAVSIVETIEGSLMRRQDAEGRIVTSTSASSSGAVADLVADDTIQVTPSAGSDCNSQLAALGGKYLALPCQASYELHGALDARDATPELAGAGAGGSAAGSSGASGSAGQPAAGSTAP